MEKYTTTKVTSDSSIEVAIKERPDLTPTILVEDFRSFYWLKEELQQFCKDEGIRTSGGKIEIAQRIEVYLKTGNVKMANLENKGRRKVSYSRNDENTIFSLDMVITEGFRCSQPLREYFKSIIGSHFHFSVDFQNWCKENVGKTYQNAVDVWIDISNKKKDKNYKTDISSQFEYNQFIRDYFDDPNNKGKKIHVAINAWKEVRSRQGDNKYRRAQ